MGAPATTLDKVRWRICDLSVTDPLLSDDALDEVIAQAVSHYTGDRPRVVVADVDGDGSAYYPLTGADAVLADWADGSSRVVSIDYPAGTVASGGSPNWLDSDLDWTFYRDADLAYLRFLAVSPSTGRTARVTYTAPHVHSDEQDTVPAGDLDALCDLAAHYGCQALATKMAASSDSLIAADSTNYRDGQLRFKQQADAWLASYRTRLGLPATGAGSGAGSGAGAGQQAGASATADWNRPATTGWPLLTHSRRWR
jgi:hypothetical protein